MKTEAELLIEERVRKEHTVPWLWCLLFGCFYFLAKKMWVHAALSAVVAWATFGLSWLVYPFFVTSLVREHFKKEAEKDMLRRSQLYGEGL